MIVGKGSNVDLSDQEVRYLTFANVSEPHVLKSACTLAVNTLELVGSDDNVRKCCAVLEDEDSSIRSAIKKLVYCFWGVEKSDLPISVRVTLASTVELLVSKVLHTGDGGRLAQGNNATRAGWDLESLCGSKARKEGGNGDSELHFE